MSNNSNEHLYFDDETGEFVVRKHVIADSSSKTSNRGTSQANIVPSGRVFQSSDTSNEESSIDQNTKICVQAGMLAGGGDCDKPKLSIYDVRSRMYNNPSPYIKQSKKEDTIGSKIWNAFKKILEWLE